MDAGAAGAVAVAGAGAGAGGAGAGAGAGGAGGSVGDRNGVDGVLTYFCINIPFEDLHCFTFKADTIAINDMLTLHSQVMIIRRPE